MLELEDANLPLGLTGRGVEGLDELADRLEVLVGRAHEDGALLREDGGLDRARRPAATRVRPRAGATGAAAGSGAAWRGAAGRAEEVLDGAVHFGGVGVLDLDDPR